MLHNCTVYVRKNLHVIYRIKRILDTYILDELHPFPQEWYSYELTMGAKNYTQFLSRANIKVICSELIDSREAIINSLEFRRCFTSNERMQNLANVPMAIWKVVCCRSILPTILVPDLTYWKTRIAKLSERAPGYFASAYSRFDFVVTIISAAHWAVPQWL